jgi:serine/threonine protein kinase
LANQWAAVLTGQSLGDYRLNHVLGEGAFGVVFEARHLTTASRVAVKVLAPSSQAEAVNDFENEGVLLRRLNECSGVVNFIDGGVGKIDLVAQGGLAVSLDVHYHAMTLASGSLNELSEDPGSRSQLAWDERIRLWRSIVKSLMQMHQYGVVHRDLKCSNCLLLVRKNETRVRFGDLGRARDLNVTAMRPPIEYVTGRGDRRFAPPEALFWQGGSTDEDFLAADYYGLGSLLVELATGQPMTAIAIGDVRNALEEGRQNFHHGIRRDLRTLNLRFRNAIAAVVAEFPKAIQEDARVVLQCLCHPEPSERLARAPYARDRMSRDKLAWILRRADIMMHRLEIDIREERRRERLSA